MPAKQTTATSPSAKASELIRLLADGMDVAKIKSEEWDSVPAFGHMLKAPPDVQCEIIRQAVYLASASNGDGTPPPLSDDSLYRPVLASVRATPPIEAEWKQMGRDAVQRPDNLVRMLDAFWRKPLVHAAKRLFKKKLPFSEADLRFIVSRTAWLEANTSCENELLPEVVSAVESFAARAETQGQLEEPIAALAQALAKCGGSRAKKLHWRLVEVQQQLSRLPAPRVATEPKPGDAGAAEQAKQLANRLRKAAAAAKFWGRFDELRNLAETKNILSADLPVRVAFVRNTMEQIATVFAKHGRPDRLDVCNRHPLADPEYPLAEAALLSCVLGAKLIVGDSDLEFIVTKLCTVGYITTYNIPFGENIVEMIEARAKRGAMTSTLIESVVKLRDASNSVLNAPEQKLVSRLSRISAAGNPLPLHAGEAWSDAAIADLKAMKEAQQAKSLSLLAHCQSASGGAPSAKWLKAARALLKEVGAEAFQRRLLAWFPLVNEPRTQRVEEWHREHQPDPNQLIIEPHADILKGLAWFAGLRENKELARALTALALSCYRKIPLKGPREVKVGNACVAALGLTGW